LHRSLRPVAVLFFGAVLALAAILALRGRQVAWHGLEVTAPPRLRLMPEDSVLSVWHRWPAVDPREFFVARPAVMAFRQVSRVGQLSFAQARTRCAEGADFCRLNDRALAIGPTLCLEYSGSNNLVWTDSLRVYRCQLPLPQLEVRYGCRGQECNTAAALLAMLRPTSQAVPEQRPES